MKIKAILFDMDGVLIEAKDWHYEALNRALNLFGMPISRSDHLTYFNGLPTAIKLEMLSADRGLPKQLHAFLNEMKQQYTIEMVHTQCYPNFIHELALFNLKHRGYKLAVCSNSIRSTVELMMRRSSLDKYLDIVISNEDVVHGKPDPEIYIKAMTHFGLKPEECLIIEDNEHGIKAAKASKGHLLVVKDIQETNLKNIFNCIEEIEEGKVKVEGPAHGH